MPLPCPAPAWISTRWPARVNSSTPTGIRATRDSCVLISLGTPTTSFPPCAIGSPRSSGKKVEPQRHRGHREDQRSQVYHSFGLLCVLCASVVISLWLHDGAVAAAD